MEELEIQGKKYISSKRAAEITGYAKDYVGQLARGGKVPATRVGRSWYIDEQAILNHSQGKTEPKAPSQAATEHTLQKKPLSSLKIPDSNVLNTWGSIKYVEDDSDLVPVLSLINEKDVTESKVTIQKSTPQVKTPNLHAIEGVQVRRRADIGPPKAHKRDVKAPLLLIGGTTMITLIVAGGALFGSSEWSFDTTNKSYITASVGDIDLILSYFTQIFDDSIALIAEFLSILLGSLEELFNIGLNFLLDLVNSLLG